MEECQKKRAIVDHHKLLEASRIQIHTQSSKDRGEKNVHAEQDVAEKPICDEPTIFETLELHVSGWNHGQLSGSSSKIHHDGYADNDQ